MDRGHDTGRESNAQLREYESRSCDNFAWYKGRRPIHTEWYKYPPGVCRSGDMSNAPTGFEFADANDIMRLSEELDREEAGVLRRSTKKEEKVARRVDAMRLGDWKKVAEMDRRDEQLRTHKRLEHQAYRARKKHATEARKRRNCDPASDSER